MTTETRSAAAATTEKTPMTEKQPTKKKRPAPRRERNAGSVPDPLATARTAPIERFALIIGAMKSGTTSLYYYLAAHPEVAAGRDKEPNFFTRPRSWPQGPKAYYALWPEFDPGVHRYALEASTDYTKFPRRKRAPQRMKALGRSHGARFKFLYILRNPIDRIESHLAHSIARRANGPGRAIDPDNIEGALAASRYALQLRRYLRHFPREDLMLLDFDELRENPRALVGRAFDFLGLETPADFAIRPPSNPRRDAGGSAAFRLDEARRAAIRDALRADVTELRDRFGVEVGRWDIL